MKSLVLIIPSDLLDEANLLGSVIGWGPNNYSVPLKTNTAVTHYGLHTWARQDVVDLIEAAKTGYKPDELASFPDAVFSIIMNALIVSVRDMHEDHFIEVVAENNLSYQIDEEV